ncbi:hypothetical protein LXA43DRAFT_1093007 [Ganoderma leucocontextum]|nr:hypothetical protein LXA43DRAFT_1093007 [Ganoderma leucocontextum]
MVSARNGKAAASKSRAGSSQQPASPAPPQPPGSASAATGIKTHGLDSTESISTRQRRVQPTRSRRGGPGVGTCESDVMILETMKRRFENEPLIPATTPFLLTTNSALVPATPTPAPAPPPDSNSNAASTSTSEAANAQLNTLAYGRYFDRPEVRKAYMEQQLIQTPEFTELPQDAHVGGRFRPRNSEDVRPPSARTYARTHTSLFVTTMPIHAACAVRHIPCRLHESPANVQETVDTSDAAYEKRHRKYETFEKRQRLREKEKLKHEHYKLKERIEQLRGMDTSAFLAIPASEFDEARSNTPGAGAGGAHAPADEPASASASASTSDVVDAFSLSLHGAAAYHEGERRRKEMLDVAMALEERYRTLLPPDRRWMEKKEMMKSKGASVEVIEVEDEGEEEVMEVVEEGEDEVVEEEEEEEKDELEEAEKDELEEAEEDELEEEEDEDEEDELVEEEDEGESEIDAEEIEQRKSKQLKLRIKFLPRMFAPKEESPNPFPTRGGGKQITLSPFFKNPSGGKSQTTTSSLRSASYAEKYGRYSEEAEDTLPSPPPAKRRRVHGGSASAVVKPTKYAKSAKSKWSKAARAANDADAWHDYGEPHSGLAGRKEPTCVLLVAAIRQSSAPTARKTQRHVAAFGCRVPQEIEEVRDFEIPAYVLAEESASQVGDHKPKVSHDSRERGEDKRSVSVDDPGT